MENEPESKFEFSIDIVGILACLFMSCGIGYFLSNRKRRKTGDEKLEEVKECIRVSEEELETLMKMKQMDESGKKSTSVTKDVSYLTSCLQVINKTADAVREAIRDERDPLVIEEIKTAFEDFCSDIKYKYSSTFGEELELY